MTNLRLIAEAEAFLYNQGTYYHAYNKLGAHIMEVDGQTGVGFVVWAPNASHVWLVGDFNSWQGEGYELTQLPGGFWQIFTTQAKPGDLYKYRILTRRGRIMYKADPFAFMAEKRPGTASRVTGLAYEWHDTEWLHKRSRGSHFEKPLNIYEMHLGSWRRKEGTPDNPEGFLSYRELAAELPRYLVDMGFTHVEFMPVMEHPFDGSWGYQTTGYFAPTSRYGSPQDFMFLVDSLHQAGIGVILDWVPGHFCRDEHGLVQFDGSNLYETEEHIEWGTYKFNYRLNEVRSFLISSAMFWLDIYHADGIRCDGISSMLYLNYGVGAPNLKRFNERGGEEDLTAVAFLQQLNQTLASVFPDVFMIAEESTAWPLVTYPPAEGGLGFHYKWDMGWMNDTLKYMSLDFPGRFYNHRLLTLYKMFAFNVKFVLPLYPDEVVHGKPYLIGRMPGDYWRQFANLRLLYLYQMTHSGAKLNFMGNEMAQFIEWRFAEQLEWFLLDYEKHAQYKHFVARLNKLYLQENALWRQNYNWDGFKWLEADNAEQSVLLFLRSAKAPERAQRSDFVLVLLNFLPDSYQEYQVGVPFAGDYLEIFNSDAAEFGGSGKLNPGRLTAEKQHMHGQPYTLTLRVPPLGGLIIKPVK